MSIQDFWKWLKQKKWREHIIYYLTIVIFLVSWIMKLRPITLNYNCVFLFLSISLNLLFSARTALLVFILTLPARFAHSLMYITVSDIALFLTFLFFWKWLHFCDICHCICIFDCFELTPSGLHIVSYRAVQHVLLLHSKVGDVPHHLRFAHPTFGSGGGYFEHFNS